MPFLRMPGANRTEMCHAFAATRRPSSASTTICAGGAAAGVVGVTVAAKENPEAASMRSCTRAPDSRMAASSVVSPLAVRLTSD